MKLNKWQREAVDLLAAEGITVTGSRFASGGHLVLFIQRGSVTGRLTLSSSPSCRSNQKAMMGCARRQVGAKSVVRGGNP